MTETNSQDWQHDFIATNLLIIGYNAWVGYLSGGLGTVVCSTNTPTVGAFGETFPAHFVPRRRLATFLNAWLAAPDTVLLQKHFMNGYILQVVDHYNPYKDVVLLLEYANQAAFLNLTNLPIAPPKCYEIVCRGWTEFQPEDTKSKERKR
jgi:hypothetical protein